MFTDRSLRGRILNRALHHQHARIYNYDRKTIYGLFPEPCNEMSLKFLDLAHWDQGGRIFTYVITLDGQFRFTETGKEFGIDLLSKHTMHSDVNIYVAFSGEFFVHRPATPLEPEKQGTHPLANIEGGPPESELPKDPRYYELIIDNDSGTYRPTPTLLPQLKEYLHHNFPGINIVTFDCDKDAKKLEKLKSQQRETKKQRTTLAFVQRSPASSTNCLASSDGEQLDHMNGQPNERGDFKKTIHDIAEPRTILWTGCKGTRKGSRMIQRKVWPPHKRPLRPMD